MKRLQLLIGALVPLLAPMGAFAADDTRVSFLEQEVRNLQRQVQLLSRKVDELTTRPARPGARAVPSPSSAVASDAGRWIDSRKWQQLRVGMSEVDVVGALGPPTSMREDGGARTLYYALEIGTSGFLGGSVVLRDRVVAEIRKPELQ